MEIHYGNSFKYKAIDEAETERHKQRSSWKSDKYIDQNFGAERILTKDCQLRDVCAPGNNYEYQNNPKRKLPPTEMSEENKCLTETERHKQRRTSWKSDKYIDQNFGAERILLTKDCQLRDVYAPGNNDEYQNNPKRKLPPTEMSEENKCLTETERHKQRRSSWKSDKYIDQNFGAERILLTKDCQLRDVYAPGNNDEYQNNPKRKLPPTEMSEENKCLTETERHKQRRSSWKSDKYIDQNFGAERILLTKDCQLRDVCAPGNNYEYQNNPKRKLPPTEMSEENKCQRETERHKQRRSSWKSDKYIDQNFGAERILLTKDCQLRDVYAPGNNDEYQNNPKRKLPPTEMSEENKCLTETERHKQRRTSWKSDKYIDQNFGAERILLTKDCQLRDVYAPGNNDEYQNNPKRKLPPTEMSEENKCQRETKRRKQRSSWKSDKYIDQNFGAERILLTKDCQLRDVYAPGNNDEYQNNPKRKLPPTDMSEENKCQRETKRRKQRSSWKSDKYIDQNFGAERILLTKDYQLRDVYAPGSNYEHQNNPKRKLPPTEMSEENKCLTETERHKQRRSSWKSDKYIDQNFGAERILLTKDCQLRDVYAPGNNYEYQNNPKRKLPPTEMSEENKCQRETKRRKQRSSWKSDKYIDQNFGAERILLTKDYQLRDVYAPGSNYEHQNNPKRKLPPTEMSEENKCLTETERHKQRRSSWKSDKYIDQNFGAERILLTKDCQLRDVYAPGNNYEYQNNPKRKLPPTEMSEENKCQREIKRRKQRSSWKSDKYIDQNFGAERILTKDCQLRDVCAPGNNYEYQNNPKRKLPPTEMSEENKCPTETERHKQRKSKDRLSNVVSVSKQCADESSKVSKQTRTLSNTSHVNKLLPQTSSSIGQSDPALPVTNSNEARTNLVLPSQAHSSLAPFLGTTEHVARARPRATPPTPVRLPGRYLVRRTPSELAVLEQSHANCSNPKNDEISRIARVLGLHYRQVSDWFRHRKYKK